jgi:hypothetical protein
VCRDTLGQPLVAGTGADGDGSAFVDAADYSFWKSKFGNVAPGAGSGGGAGAVPEPTSLVLALVGLAGIWRYVRRDITNCNCQKNS